MPEAVVRDAGGILRATSGGQARWCRTQSGRAGDPADRSVRTAVLEAASASRGGASESSAGRMSPEAGSPRGLSFTPFSSSRSGTARSRGVPQPDTWGAQRRGASGAARARAPGGRARSARIQAAARWCQGGLRREAAGVEGAGCRAGVAGDAVSDEAQRASPARARRRGSERRHHAGAVHDARLRALSLEVDAARAWPSLRRELAAPADLRRARSAGRQIRER